MACYVAGISISLRADDYRIYLWRMHLLNVHLLVLGVIVFCEVIGMLQEDYMKEHGQKIGMLQFVSLTEHNYTLL